MPKRVIAHLDCDAFYVSVELSRRPELRGRPVIVCGSGPRAVVTTASYEARAFGVGSAMSAAEARRRCPQAVVVPPDMAAYKQTSAGLWAIIEAQFPVVQRLGLDEAYVDLTGVDKPLPRLREAITEVLARTGIQISAGVAPNRLVAKIASDLGKPAGFVAIGREDAARRLGAHSVRLIPGIGPKTAVRLAELGVGTIGERQQLPEQTLVQRFGPRQGRELHRRSFLHDDSPVVTEREIKSRSAEVTFDSDVEDIELLRRTVCEMSARLATGLRSGGQVARTIGIKLRLHDWETITRARTLPAPTDQENAVAAVALALLSENSPRRPVRLVGVRVASLAPAGVQDPAHTHPRGGQLVLSF